MLGVLSAVRARGLRRCAVLCLFLLPALCASRAVFAQTQAAGTDAQVQQLYSEAKIAEAQGDTAGAVAKYKSILEISPRLGAAYNNLGSLYVRQRDYPDAIAILEKGLKVDPKMASAVALLGISYYEMGDYSRARPLLEAALRANPKDSNIELL